LNPSSTRAHTHYALLFRAIGELDRAVLEGQTALDLDPLNVPVRFNLAYELMFARRFDEAAAHYRELLELNPRSVAAHWALATNHELQARYEEAGTEMMTVLRLLGDDAAEEEFGRLLGAHGYVEARRWLDSRDVERELNQEQPDAWFLAYTYARLNDRDRAFEWLERAYQARDPGLLQIRVDWDFESLRSDARFADLVDRVGFPP